VDPRPRHQVHRGRLPRDTASRTAGGGADTGSSRTSTRTTTAG
jgi:hypothetical protein